jgi:hypothetical protein
MHLKLLSPCIRAGSHSERNESVAYFSPLVIFIRRGHSINQRESCDKSKSSSEGIALFHWMHGVPSTTPMMLS